MGDENDAIQAYDLTNKQLLIQVFFGLFFGFFADKYNKFKILMFIIFCSIIAVFLFILSPDPYNFLIYISMLFFGLSNIGFATFTTQVISKYPNPRFRASVLSVSQITLILGAATTGVLGMYLTQYNPYIAFYIYLGCSVVGLGILCVVYIRNKDVLEKI